MTSHRMQEDAILAAKLSRCHGEREERRFGVGDAINTTAETLHKQLTSLIERRDTTVSYDIVTNRIVKTVIE